MRITTFTLLASSSLFTLAALASAANTTVAAGQTLTLTENLQLTGSDTLEVNGTADKPCIIEGNGFEITNKPKDLPRNARPPEWSGHVKLTYCTLHSLGKPLGGGEGAAGERQRNVPGFKITDPGCAPPSN